jgi:hypothetical protein
MTTISVATTAKDVAQYSHCALAPGLKIATTYKPRSGNTCFKKRSNPAFRSFTGATSLVAIKATSTLKEATRMKWFRSMLGIQWSANSSLPALREANVVRPVHIVRDLPQAPAHIRSHRQ